MASFDYDVFYGDDNCIGFNAQKYSKEQALEIGARELETDIENVRIDKAYIYYGYGTDCDGENRRTYWICGEPKGNCFDAWAVTKKYH